MKNTKFLGLVLGSDDVEHASLWHQGEKSKELQFPLESLSEERKPESLYDTIDIPLELLHLARSLTRSCTSDFIPLLEIANCAAKDQQAKSISQTLEQQKLRVTFSYCRNSLKQCAM
jgi:hypothetical protein